MSGNEEKNKDWVKIIALFLSIISLFFHGLNYYNTWYVPERAELSVLFTESWYQLDLEKQNLKTHASGVLINEGARTTQIKIKYLEVVFFDYNENKQVHFSSSITYINPYDYVGNSGNIIPAGGSINFNMTGDFSLSILENHELSVTDFRGLFLRVLHDDGLGILENVKNEEYVVMISED